MAEQSSADATEQFRKIVDDFLAAAAPTLEGVVDSKAYGELLGQTVANLVAVNRINSDTMDLTLRNLRIASRADVVSLHRQLARTEDKLEMVLEVVERIEDELAELRRQAAEAATGPSADAKPAPKPAAKSAPKQAPKR